MATLLSLCIMTFTLILSQSQTIINIGGIFDPIHSSEYDAFIQAIDDINAGNVNNADIFTGITFNASYVIQSSSSSIKETATMLSTGVSTVIGPRYSKQAERLSPLFTLAKTPYVSYRASASGLSDRTIFPYFFRTVPDILDLAVPIIHIFQRYDWEQAVLIHSSGHWGRGLNFLVQVGAENDIAFKAVEIQDGFTVEMIADTLELLTEYEIFVLHVPTDERAAIYEAAESVNLIKEGVAWIGTEDIALSVSSETTDTKGRMEGSLAIRPKIPQSDDTLDAIPDIDWHSYFVYDAVLVAAHALAFTQNDLGLDVTATSALDTNRHFGVIQSYLTDGEALSNSLTQMQLASDWTLTGSIYLRGNTRRMPYELVNLQDAIWQTVAEFNWNADSINEAIANDSYCNQLSAAAKSAAADEYNELTSDFAISDCSLSFLCNSAVITFYDECLAHLMGLDITYASSASSDDQAHSQWTDSSSNTIQWSTSPDIIPIGAQFSKNNRLKVLLYIIEPWGKYTPDAEDSILGYTGFLPTLWDYVATAHGLDSEYFDGSLYSQQHALDLVQNGSYDVALGAFTITSDRSSRVRFLHQFYGGGQRILTLDPNIVDSTPWFFLAPLSVTMWQVWLIAIVIVAHLLWIMEWDTPTFKELDENTGRMKRMSYHGAMLEALTVSTSVLFFTHEAPRGKHSRVLILVWQYIVLILVSAYTANMVSFITNSSAVESVIADLSSLYLEETSVITVPNTASADILEAANISYTACDSPYICLEMMYDSINNSYNASKDEYYNAFVYDDINVEYWARTSVGCNLITSGTPFNSFSAAIATRYEFIPESILGSIDLLIIKLWSNGTITNWREEFISAEYPCAAFEGAVDETTPLDVFSFYPLWVLIGAGSILFCTVVICTVERSHTPIDEQLEALNKLVEEGAEQITRVGTLESIATPSIQETKKKKQEALIEMEVIKEKEAIEVEEGDKYATIEEVEEEPEIDEETPLMVTEEEEDKKVDVVNEETKEEELQKEETPKDALQKQDSRKEAQPGVIEEDAEETGKDGVEEEEEDSLKLDTELGDEKETEILLTKKEETQKEEEVKETDIEDGDKKDDNEETALVDVDKIDKDEEEQEAENVEEEVQKEDIVDDIKEDIEDVEANENEEETALISDEAIKGELVATLSKDDITAAFE